MNRTRCLRISFLALLAIGYPPAVGPSIAAVFTWDGGNGAWDTTTLNWDGGTNAWPAAGSDHEAIFGGTPGTVSIDAGGVAANGLTFNASGYLINGDTLTFNGTNPFVDVGTSVSAAIEAPIAGSGLLQRTGAGTGELTIGGTVSNTFSGTTRIVHGLTFLDKSGGAFAIAGPLEMGGTLNQPQLRTLQNEQFAPGVVVDFINPSGQWTRLDLLGTTQTLAGINTGDATTQGSGVVQIRSNGDVTSEHGPSTLTLNGGGNYLFNGHLRNVDGGAAGTNVLSLAKNGGGTQTLVGSQITYSGATTIEDGTLELRETGNNFASQIEVDAGGTLDVVYSTTGVGARRDLAGPLVTGAGVININNAGAGIAGGWTTVNVTNSGRIWNFDGTININSGVLTRDHVATDTIRGTATVNIAADGVLGTRGGGVIIGALNGSGRVSPLWVGASASTLTLGNGGDSGNFSGTIHGNGSNATDGTLEGGILSLVKVGGGTQTLSGSLTYTGNTSVNEGVLALSQTTNFASATTTVNPGGTLELHSTNAGVDNWPVNTVLTGAGTINKTGSGWIQTFTNAHTFSGTFNIQEGAFGAAFLTSNWTGVTADFHIDAGALLDARGQAITVGSLNGAGNVGTTWVEPATVTVGAGDKSGDFSGTIHGNASAGNNLVANPNAGVLSLIKTGTGTQVLSGANTFTGSVTVDGGILRGSAGNAFGAADSARTITVNSGATVEFNQVGMYGAHSSTDVPSLIINAGGTVRNTLGNNPLNNVTLNGGTLTATASNGVWGSWNINGTIASTGNSFITPGTAPAPGILLQSAAVSNTGINVINGNLTISAPIGNGRFGGGNPEVVSSLTKLGGGVLYLDGSNSYTGDTFVNGGYLVARHSNALGAAGDSHVASGATLQLENNAAIAGETAHIVGDGVGGTRGALASWTGNNTWGGEVVLAGDSRIFVNADSMEINNTISESAAGSGLLKSGAGTLTLGGAAPNTYTGMTTTQNHGVLQLNKPSGVAAIPGDLTIVGSIAGIHSRVYTLADNQFGANSVIDFQGPSPAILELLGTTQTMAGLSGDNSGIIQNRQFGGGSFGTGHVILNGSGNYAFDGWLRDGFLAHNPDPGVLALTKDGGGTQVLSGSNTYTGNTTVNAGTLLVHGTHSGGGQYTVNAGGTLGGNGSVTAGVNLLGTMSPGASIGTFNTGSEVWNNGGSFLFEIDDATGTAGATGGPGWDLLAITGTLDLTNLSPGGFTIDIVSLESGGGTNPGLIDNFNGGQSYLWEFVTTTGGVIGFDANLFTLNDGGFANPFGGSFAVLQTSNGLALAYVPEPGAFVLGLLGVVGVVLLLWRRKRC